MRVSTFKWLAQATGIAVGFVVWLSCSILASYGIMYLYLIPEKTQVYMGDGRWQTLNPPDFWHPQAPIYFWILAFLAGFAVSSFFALMFAIAIDDRSITKPMPR